MISCPNCQALNEPNSRFCIGCGQTLAGVRAANPTAKNPTQGYRRNLFVATGQTVIALFLVWFLRGVLTSLSFVEGLVVVDIPFSAAQVITFIAYLIAFFLLIGLAQTLRAYWPLAFPALRSLTPALLVIIYVVLLSFAYQALRPILVELLDDPRDFVLALRVVLTILSVGLLAWAGKAIYDSLPGWLGEIRFETPSGAYSGLICANCGQTNPADHRFCGYCGQTLTAEADAARS